MNASRSTRLRLLIVDGNTRELRAEHAAGYGGLEPGAAYAETVRALAPDAEVDVALPCDEQAGLPQGAALEGYDGVFLTGSALHIYRREPAVERQIELMRAIYASGTPCFGSCWGLQLGAVAAGGSVVPNPKGREVGFARRIVASPEGAAHPLLAGRPASFDAPAIHLDTVETLPQGATLLASNGMSRVQAAEIRQGPGLFWGVQYHPEFPLVQVASILRRMTPILIAEGFRRDEPETDRWLGELENLDAEPGRTDLAWQHGLDAEILDPRRRVTELANFLDRLVRSVASERGRA